MRELYLIQFDGHQYGVWKDEVLSVKDIPAFHRIPLSPACVAGMAVIDDTTVMLADLGICIGHPRPVESGPGQVLLVPGREKTTGFIVNGKIHPLPVQPDEVLRIPAYLASTLIDTCCIHGEMPIPIINIAVLYDLMLKTNEDTPVASLTLPPVRHGGGTMPTRIRVFTLGDDLYALSEEGLEQGSLTPGPIVRLMNTPRYVRGVSRLDERIMPVIDLSQRITRRKIRSRARMLVADIGETEFGLLVDDEKESAAAGNAVIKPLPLLAQSSWLRSAALNEGGILPVIDLGELLSLGDDEHTEAAPVQHYTPDSSFSSIFRRGEVEVVEFSLLGVRHALPKTEVEDVVDVKLYREIPNAPQIVIGVTDYNGELILVLDLALVFGRISIVTPAWKMILVKNGDFRALVITEAVYGERRLSPDLHRIVPIALPHNVVYGCYPDAEAVRLILNVEAMASHFEKSLVQELLPAMSREMKEAPSRVVPTLLGLEKEEEEPRPAEVLESIPVGPELVSAAAGPTGPASLVPEETSKGSEFKELGDVQEIVQGAEERVQEEPAAVAAASGAPEEGPTGFKFEEAGKVQEDAQEAEEREREEPATVSAALGVGEAESAAVQELGSANEPDPEKIDENLPPSAVEVSKEEGEREFSEKQVEEPVGGTSIPAEETAGLGEEIGIHAPGETEEEQDKAGPEQESEESVEEELIVASFKEREPEQVVEEQEVVRVEPVAEDESVVVAEPTGKAEEVIEAEPVVEAEQAATSLHEREPAASDMAIEEGHLPKTQEEESSVGQEPAQTVSTDTSVAVVEDLNDKKEESLLEPEMPSSIDRTGFPESVPEDEPIPEKQVPDRIWRRRLIAGAIGVVLVLVLYLVGTYHRQAVEPPAQQTEAARQEPAQEKGVSPRSAEKPVTPLVLEIPSSGPVDGTVYVVRKGDTLWSISKRFTGNPFNYPHIAGENRIADPDLIFPGQKIRLKKR